jgi:hypothetical protein
VVVNHTLRYAILCFNTPSKPHAQLTIQATTFRATQISRVVHKSVITVKDLTTVVNDFHLCKRRGRQISGGVQAAPLSELRQGLGVWVKAFHTK